MTQTLGEAMPGTGSDLAIIHAWMSKKARRRDDIVVGDYLDLVHEGARRNALSARRVSDAMKSLLDTGCIEKMDAGFLVTEKFEELAATPASPDLTETYCARSARDGEESASEASTPTKRRPQADLGFKHGSAQNEVAQYEPEPVYPRSRVVVLARSTFPSLCLDAGIAVHPMQFSWVRLAAGIRRWQKDYGVSLDFVRQMMVQFVTLKTIQHTKYSPDVCFLARREQLTGMVLAQQKRDPGNRRHSGGAEYWLGRYAR